MECVLYSQCSYIYMYTISILIDTGKKAILGDILTCRRQSAMVAELAILI